MPESTDNGAAGAATATAPAEPKAPRRRSSAAASTAAAGEQTIEVPQIDVQRIMFKLVGDSPLICHRWSEKAKAMIENKQQKKPTPGREARDPDQEFRDSLHVIDETEKIYGFPAVGFKTAMVSACRYADMKMTVARGAFHVIGDLIPIISGPPTRRDDMVRIGNGVADIRYRGQFDPWAVEVEIAYNARAVSPEQLTNLLNLAGFGVGVGEWRPENDGSYGRFHVQTEDEAA